MFFVAIYPAILYIVPIYPLPYAMNWLEVLRNDIERIDSNIFDLLEKRQGVSQKIWRYKKEHNMPIVDMEQFVKLLSAKQESAKRAWLNEEYIKQLWTIIHDESVRIQEAA